MPIPMKASPGVREQVMAERERQGPMTSGQWLTLVVFAGAAISWLLGQQIGLDDAVIAIIAALLLFILQARDPATGRTRPLLTWNEASRVPWGILLLFGGGLSLAAAIRHTGVDAYIAGGAGALAGLPLLVLLWIIAFVTILLTEFTSNTALVAAALPVGEALAQRLGVPPAAVLTTLTLTASLGFMLPAGTAPNALVFASKQVTMRQMMKAGLALDIACAALVPLLVVGLLSRYSLRCACTSVGGGPLKAGVAAWYVTNDRGVMKRPEADGLLIAVGEAYGAAAVAGAVVVAWAGSPWALVSLLPASLAWVSSQAK